MEAPQFCNFSSKEFGSRIESSLMQLQKEKYFCDVTITCEGRQIDAHKVVLARGSRIFNNILKLNPQSHPLIFLSDVKFSYLLNILDFMYQGEVSIDKRELNNYLAVARHLELNDITEEAFKDSKQSVEDKSKKQRLSGSLKQQFNVDYKIKTDKLDEDFEQFADEDFVNFNDESEGLTEEAFKDSKQSIEDKSKNQRLSSSLKQQFNVNYKIKTDNKLEEDFEQFADEDFVNFNDESEGVPIKKNLMDSIPKQDLNVEYKIKIAVAGDLEDNDLTKVDIMDSKEFIENKSKKQRIGSSPKQQLNMNYKIKTDNKLDDFHTVFNDLKMEELEDLEQFTDEDFLNFDDESEGITIKKNLIDSNPKQDLNVDYKIEIELKMENKNSEKNEKIISKQDPIKEQSNRCVQKLLIRDIAKLSENENQSISIESDVSKISFECEHCNKTYSSKQILKKHVLSIHEGMRYPCSLCDYKATSEAYLKRHILSIHERMRYPCSHCDYKATSKAHMKIHVLSIHEGMRHPCSLCDYKATKTESLKRHILSIHEGMRYPCSHCDYKATTKTDLKNHILSIHEGKRYPCSHCDYKATTKPHLKRHILSIHEGKRYPCSHCDYKATTKESLKKHINKCHS